jgi:predicted DNA-binding transcriptional regulator AlpA
MTTAEKVYLNSRRVKRRYGDVTGMTLWRWYNDPAMGFPQPVVINGRNLWVESELDAFDAAQVRRGAA